MSHRTRAYLMLLVAVAIWGVAGPVIKFTLDYFDPITFLTLRFLVTSLVMIPILLIKEPHALNKLYNLNLKDWSIFIIGGLTGTSIQLLLLFEGFRYTTAIDGTLISSTSPILSTLAGYYFLHEHITKRERIGLLLAFAGSIIVVFNGQLFSGTFFGNFLVFLGNIAWVAYVILSKMLTRHGLSPLLITTSNFFIGLVSMSLIFMFTHQQLAFGNMQLAGVLGVGFMGAFSGALAYFLYQRAQKTIETSEANIFIYLQPLFATPIAYLWLQESITWSFVIGASAIAIGVGISSYRRQHLG